MIITLKDGSKKEYSEAKSVIDIAYDISEGLGTCSMCRRSKRRSCRPRTVLDSDCELNILTAKDEKRTCCSSSHSFPCTCTGSTDLISGS